MSTFYYRNGWKPTFIVSCLQRETTGLHASHTQYGLVDPPHIGGHFSVDVKHILLKKNQKLNQGYGIKGWSHLCTNVGSASTDKTGQHPVHCQGSPAVSLNNLIENFFFLIAFSLTWQLPFSLPPAQSKPSLKLSPFSSTFASHSVGPEIGT